MPFAQRMINAFAVLLGWVLLLISFAALALLLPPTSMLLAVAFMSPRPVVILIIIAAVTLALGLALLITAARERKGVVRLGYCTMCGYDLRSTPSLGCPECGWGR